MSLNVPQVQVAKVIDPRLAIRTKRDYVALKGSLVNTHQAFPATTINNSSLQITSNPPNRGIVISRLVYKRVSFDITINGVNPGPGPLLSEGYYGPRAYPLASVTSSEQITLNNDTLTQAPVSQYWPALLWYHNEWRNRFGQYSLTPSMQDQFQDYNEAAGSVRNPLAPYGDNSLEITRGSYAGMEVLTNTQNQATIRLTVTEPILISPMVFGQGSNFTAGLSGIQNMSYTATLGDLRRVLSLTPTQGDPAKLITSNDIIVNLASATLLFNYLTPDPLMPVPRNLVSSYFSIVSYPTRSSVPVAPGGVVDLNMQSIQVTSIPRRIYVFARRDDAEQTAFTSDTFMSLPIGENPVSMTWNNNQFLSQCSTEDLYNISVKNNVNMNYTQFVKHTGSVLCLDFGTDIGLMSDEAPGSLGNYQMSVRARFRNTSAAALTPTLYVVVVYEGTFNVRDGNCSHMIGVLSRKDVLDSRRTPGVTYSRAMDVYGGSFFNKLGSAFRKAHDWAKDNKVLSRGLSVLPHPAAQVAAKAASMAGYGMSGGSLMNMSDLAEGDGDADETHEQSRDREYDHQNYKYDKQW